MKKHEPIVVSPFEYAIRQAVGDEKGYRPETWKEREERVIKKAKEFAKKINTKNK